MNAFEGIKSITMNDYLFFIRETDRLPEKDLSPVLHGLFGEVGSLMTAAKKLKREPNVFTGFNSAVIEEFGDAFWYLCCLAIRLNVDIEGIILDLTHEKSEKSVILTGSLSSPVAVAYKPDTSVDFDSVLIDLGQLTGNFLSEEYISDNSYNKVYKFLSVFFSAISVLGVNFGDVINHNLSKASGRFIRPKNEDLPTFDDDFEEFERLPSYFEIEYIQRTDKHQAMRWNGVFIGDPLTDNIRDKDGYRFHDVFHLSFAAILHWSPTFRALIKHKRKSRPEIDEAQDGGRAIVIEEGLAAWIFSLAKENKYFENRKNLTFDMLKNVGQIVKGFEVEACPLILWEEAILKGYEVFRKVKENNGGVVVGNKSSRSIDFKKA